MVTYMMYKIRVMDRLTMALYLNWKKTLPGLRLGAQLDKSRSTIEKIIKTEDMSQKVLPDDVPRGSRAAEPSKLVKVYTLKFPIVQESTIALMPSKVCLQYGSCDEEVWCSSWLGKDKPGVRILCQDQLK